MMLKNAPITRHNPALQKIPIMPSSKGRFLKDLKESLVFVQDDSALSVAIA